MIKKVFVLTLFWITFILFFSAIFILPAPIGTTFEINNFYLNLILQFVGMFVFSIMIVGYIWASIQYWKDFDNVK